MTWQFCWNYHIADIELYKKWNTKIRFSDFSILALENSAKRRTNQKQANKELICWPLKTVSLKTSVIHSLYMLEDSKMSLSSLSGPDQQIHWRKIETDGKRAARRARHCQCPMTLQNFARKGSANQPASYFLQGTVSSITVKWTSKLKFYRDWMDLLDQLMAVGQDAVIVTVYI